MPNLKFITEALPQKSQVLLTKSLTPLGAEIVSQLETHPNIETVLCPDPDIQLPELTTLTTLVHLAGFDHPSLSLTLSYTSTLHKLLLIARSFRSKFILVISNQKSPLYSAAITLISQFAKNYDLNYTIIEIDPSQNVAESAYEIVRKFVYGHKKPLPRAQTLAPILVPVVKPIPVKKPRPKIHFKFPTLKLPTFKFPKLLPRLKVSSAPKTPKPPKPVNLKKWKTKFSRRPAVVIGGLIVGAIVVPWLMFSLSLLAIKRSLKCTVTGFSNHDLTEAVNCSQALNTSFQFASFLAQFTPGTNQVLVDQGLPVEQTKPVVSGLESVSYEIRLLNRQTTNLISAALTGKLTQEGESSMNWTGSQLITSTNESLAQLQNQLRDLYQAVQPPSPQIAQLASSLAQFRQTLSKLQLIAPYRDSLQNGTVLVLIQDNLESRPTGGYIDSTVLLSVQNGQIVDTQVMPSQTLDSQLKGSVEPPQDFVSVTGISQWYLRDSNWDIDFPTSAKRAAWFVEKETGRQVNLVIGANLKTLGQLLEITGPVRLADNGESVSASSLESEYLNFLQSNSSNNSFIAQLTQKLFNSLYHIDKTQASQLSSVIFNLLETRQLLIAPISYNTLAFDSAGWSGGVGLPGCRSQQTCLIDYFHVNDTNISVNKSDAFLKRTVDMTVDLTPDSINHVYKLAYQNTSTQNSWPSGTNKNYLRLLFPSGTEFSDVRINQESISSANYTLSSQNGLIQLGLVVTTEPKSTSNIEITTTRSISLSSRSHYQLDIPNQSGSQELPMKITLNYPKQWFATVFATPNSPVPMVASPGQLGYNTAVNRPASFDIDITPQ